MRIWWGICNLKHVLNVWRKLKVKSSGMSQFQQHELFICSPLGYFLFHKYSKQFQKCQALCLWIQLITHTNNQKARAVPWGLLPGVLQAGKAGRRQRNHNLNLQQQQWLLIWTCQWWPGPEGKHEKASLSFFEICPERRLMSGIKWLTKSKPRQIT